MIKKARPSDFIKCFEILELAMSDFTDIIFNETSKEKKLEIFEKFFKTKNNRLSHENIMIYENENSEICGAICAYEGRDSDFLDMVFNQRLKELKAKNLIKKECDDDEFYIDSVAVLPEFRGRGYFKAMVNETINKARDLGFKKVSLITQTPEIYTKFGFKFDKNDEFYGEIYQKMILEL
ncbi:GNAT family N-acetyltransferase [Campylobacter corcagiensis]|uniref:GNAT family N-acetyltransferase n=1 Tax=Campylobacter corcagiensis TaxID=1448857 RepID=A0A7M1LHA7_9BACT|nr:GNAT family N-acetyltransferase [Campylobacter corcagiensis]QKF65475.1 acetyltransferase [Campylobacter corcagiensis]QOQ87948.1 GNAT family N-acetyltransferase [Campylobacter corcagiensis]